MRFATRNNFTWHFNPPHASHMGGAWERMIRTVRKVLLGVCVDQRLSDESFETLLTEIEAIINGRPLTKLSDNPDDPAPLTPNHLLIGSSGASLAPGKFDDADALRRRWKLVQRVADKFWTSWLKQYITGLQSRAKWQREKDNLKVGDLVLVVDELKHRNQSPLRTRRARVIQSRWACSFGPGGYGYHRVRSPYHKGCATRGYVSHRFIMYYLSLVLE